MKKKTIPFLLALCPLVPAASRLANGIILVFSVIWLLFFGILFRELVKKLDAGKAGAYIELICLAGSASLFSIIIQYFFPILSISLGFYIYLTAFSALLLVSIDYFSIQTIAVSPVITFIPFLLIFSCLRELIGSGTISYPVPSGFREITVLPAFERYGIGFWGTSGGALILLGVFAWAIKYLRRRIANYRRNS